MERSDRKLIQKVFFIIFLIGLVNLSATFFLPIQINRLGGNPAELKEDFFTRIMQNPVEINTLQSQYLYSETKISPNRNISVMYCLKLNDYNLGVQFRKYFTRNSDIFQSNNGTEYFKKTNLDYSAYKLILGKDNIAFSYNIYFKKQDNSFIDTYYDSIISNDEHVLNSHIEEEAYQIDQIKQNFEIGWKRKLSQDRSLNILGSMKIGRGDYSGSSSTNEIRDNDQDGNGIYYNDFNYDGHWNAVYLNENNAEEFQYFSPDYSVTFSGRIFRKSNEIKSTSLVGGVAWSTYETDDFNASETGNTTVSFLESDYIIADTLITEYSNYEYSGKSLKYNNLSAFIGYGKNRRLRQKWNLLLGWKLIFSSINQDKFLINELGEEKISFKNNNTRFDLNTSFDIEYNLNKYLQMRFGQYLLSTIDCNELNVDKNKNIDVSLRQKLNLGLRIFPLNSFQVDVILNSGNSIRTEPQILSGLTLSMSYIY